MITVSGEFSVKERAVMFALLAEARELSNPELEERVGFTNAVSNRDTNLTLVKIYGVSAGR